MDSKKLLQSLRDAAKKARKEPWAKLHTPWEEEDL